jgi:hypothetical protein
MEKKLNALESFKLSLDQQGFISPMLSRLRPSEKLIRPESSQEIFGYVLEGDMELVVADEFTTYGKHEIFFIESNKKFEIHAGVHGAEYLFAFKGKY